MTAPGRNDPCPCGSGEKYKKCCGTIVPIVPQAPKPAPNGARECGSCTACCEGWLAGNIHGHEMKPGTPCHFVRQGGCSIYEQRPITPCRQFICGWMRPGNPFPESFKPTESSVIIYPTKWRNRPAYRFVSAGRDPSPAMLDWMMRFCRQTGIPFSYEEAGETVAFGPREFEEEMAQRLMRGEPLW